MNREQNRIVCAANQVQVSPDQVDKVLATHLQVIGPRHWDAHMRMQAYRLAALGLIVNPFAVAWEQGFIDKYGKFHTRTAAWQIAEAAGQIIDRVGGDDADGGTLYSENMY